MASDTTERLRRIPRTDEILSHADLAASVEEFGREVVLDAIREHLEHVRSRVREGEPVPGATAIAAAVRAGLDRSRGYALGRAVNATGVILHTGLGRAVLPEEAVRALFEELRGYSVVEIDPATGERSIREAPVARLLCRLTGAESATVVNNNAGGTLLALAALAEGREVIVSRGQLVEIGGSFRMPEVMAQSRCRMVEVGTTNRTRLEDYERAITPETALLLRVHTSNFRIQGFSEEVPIEELAALGRRRGIPVLEDLGSGALFDLKEFRLPEEPSVQRSVRAGADMICFSGDKLLGGPQAGLLVGKKELIAKVRRHPLFRALRPDKLHLLALEATLRLFLDPARLPERHPTLKMLTLPRAELDKRAEALAARLKSIPALEVEILDDVSEVGGGSLPAVSLPTRVVAIRDPAMSAQSLSARLRTHRPPVFARVRQERVLLDVRTLFPSDAERIADALSTPPGA